MGPVSVGPYQIIRKIGQGAMGEVFLAHDPRLHRKVAIKRLAGDGTDNADENKRSLHEARSVARLNHPNIAAVYDIVEADGRPHIIMEYVRGQSLAVTLVRGPLPPQRVVAIGRQIAEGLAEAHRAGIIHRDLKPANVVIDDAGHAKILDFGIARRLPSQASLTSDDGGAAESGRESETYPRAGTPAYMAPERFRGEPASVRTDIYSLGVLLFECLTGSRPFSGPLANSREAVLHSAAPSLDTAVPQSPRELNRVVTRALERDASKRYGDARELSRDLGAVEVAFSRTSTARGDGLHAAKASRARKWGAVTLAVAVLAGASLWQRQAAAPPPRTTPPVVAVMPLAASGEDRSLAVLEASLGSALVTALSRIPGLVVVSRSSMLPYRESRDVRKAARELGANFVVDGLLEGTGGTLRATLHLVEPASGRVLWSDDFEGDLGLGAGLQREVAAAVSDELRLRVPPDQMARIGQPLTANAEALADYSQGTSFYERADVPGNIDRAITLFKNAIDKDRSFGAAWGGLGKASWEKYLQTKERSWSDAARDAVAEAIRLAPDEPAVLHSYAFICNSTGRYEQAVSALRHALTLQPDNDDAHRSLGRILSDQGDVEAGVAQLRAAVRLRPNFWRNHQSLGLAQYHAGQMQEALASFRRVTELQPDSSYGFQMMGAVEHALGRHDAARAAYNAALEIAQDPYAYTGLGLLHYEARRFVDAATAYEAAVKLEPNAADYRNLGDTYSRLGKVALARNNYEKAVALCEDDVKLNPRSAEAIARLGVLQAKLGRTTKALALGRQAAQLGPRNAEVLYRVAVLNALAGQRKAAADWLLRAFQAGYSRDLAARDEDLALLGTPAAGAANEQAVDVDQAKQGGKR